MDALEAAERPDLSLRVQEEVTPESLRRVGAHELAAAVVMESPAAARRHGVRIDALRDEPLLAALPESHRYAPRSAIPIGAFAPSACVLLPREPARPDVQRVAAGADSGSRSRALTGR